MQNRQRHSVFSRKSSRILLLVFVLLLSKSLTGTNFSSAPALIPLPQKVVWNGQKFRVGKKSGYILKRITSSLSGVPGSLAEAYVLKVVADSVVLTATTEAGIFRGLQTIRQLTVVQGGVQFVTGCSITDWPAFRIRGFMQDAGRNFMPLPLLKEQIDVMASYKYNVFHFHLTDNPGWRLESRKYPQLKAATSMSRWPGKYYSREDFLEIVSYCAARHIQVIPELDVPGHCEAFRRAFALDSMSDPRVQPILLDLVDEICSLVPAQRMPFLHLGTDEVGQKHERPAPGLLKALIARARLHGREVIVWHPGQQIENDETSVTQLWSERGKAKEGHPYIDSRLNYLNHLDPLAGVAQLYVDRICGKAAGDSMALGGILCCWNDNNVSEPADILAQNPVYPGMVTYSETSWHGRKDDPKDNFLARMPSSSSPLYQQFHEFEQRLIRHRDLYFKGKPFPYVRQSEMAWSLVGPFDNKGDVNRIFPVEDSLQMHYAVNDRSFEWSEPIYGGTLHIHHFFGYPSYFTAKTGTVYATTNIWSPENQEVGCWIGFHDWSRSGGRRGGPLPLQGEWHTTHPKVWLNGIIIGPPVWNHPGLAQHTDEIPFTDENYFHREPTKIFLKKGWNRVLLKVPQNGKSWKWMFTFVPVRTEKGQVREVEGLTFSVDKVYGSVAFNLSPVFGEHMVFQQKKPIVIYGTAAVEDEITVNFGGHSGSVRTEMNGAWRLELPAMPAGGPYQLVIRLNGQVVKDWKDILVGEVWFCSGQSNMQFRVDQSDIQKPGGTNLSDDQLRLMNYHGLAETSDQRWDSVTLSKINRFDYFKGTWQRNSPAEAAGFSAIAWQFGKELRERLNVPVGLIQVAVGGAPAESFVDDRTLFSNPRLSSLFQDWSGNELVMDWCRQRALKNVSLNPQNQLHPFMPSYIFRAGISSFTGFPVSGIIWYQGESNAHNVPFHELLFPELVQSWRKGWNLPGLPFIFAQLSSVQRPGWEDFRDNQRRFVSQIPYTAMVVTSDLGDSLNVHPIHKKEIGHRFALQALQKVYLKKLIADGPLPVKAVKKNGILELLFRTRNLTTSDGTPLRELEIAGVDRIFHFVKGDLKGDRLLVDPGNLDVRLVRYGWKPFSRGNLTNMEGLPASTFVINVN